MLITNLGAVIVFALTAHVTDLPADKAQDPTEELRKKLEAPSDKLKTGIDKGTPLADAIEFFGRIHHLTIKIDVAAFQRKGIKNVEQAQLEVPPLPRIPTGRLLQFMLDGMEPDATFIIKRDHVLIVPGKPKPPRDESKDSPAARELTKVLSEPTDRFKNGIDAGTPFKDALDFLCRAHGPVGFVIYVIDHRAFKERGAPDIVEKQVKFPPTAKAPFNQILEQLLAQVEAEYLVQADGYFLVVPAKPKGK